MGLPRIVPFKDSSELDTLGMLLFGTYPAQQRGLARAKALQVRGPLPPSVNVTCLMVSAIHSDVPSNDMYAIRQAYSMALIRLVNETLDSYQTNRVAIPLHALAREAKLPGVFVEFRHAATHEDLPSVYLLRSLSSRAMDWLWENFWQPAVESSASIPGSTGVPATPSRGITPLVTPDTIKDTLRGWRRLRRSSPSRELSGDELKVAGDFGVMFSAVPEDVLSVLFKRNILIPTGAGSPEKRALGGTLLWGPLFAHTGAEFQRALTERLIEARNQQVWPSFEPLKDDRLPAYQVWLVYLVPLCGSWVTELLAEQARPWNAELLALYASTHHTPANYALAKEMAAVTGVAFDLPAPARGTGTGTPPVAQHSGFPSMQPEDRSTRWPRVENWTPRPLGVI